MKGLENGQTSDPYAAGAAVLPREADSTRRVAGAAMVMIAGVALSRVTGVVRVIVFAHLFGVSSQTDAYVQAFRVPDFLYFLMAGGALATGFIPTFTERLAKGREAEAWRTLSALFTALLAAATVLVAAGMILAPWLTPVVGPTFDAETRSLCARMMRIIFPAQLCFVLGGLLMGTLHSLRVFVWSALAPTIYNVFIIAGALLLGPSLGVEGMAWGALLGAVVGQLGMQLLPVLNRGAKLRLRWDLHDEGLREVARLILPVGLGLCIFQINIVIASVIAQSLGKGQASAFTYAFQLVNLPLGMFGQGLTMSLFPALSSHAAREEMAEFRLKLSQGMRQIVFLCIPSSLFMAILATPVIRVLLQTGRFSASDAHLTASLLSLLSLTVTFVGVQQLVSRGFYSLKESRVPVMVGAPTAVITVGLNYGFSRVMGIAGIGVAQTISAAVNSLIMCRLLSRRTGGLHGREVGRTLWQSLLCSLLACVAALLFVSWYEGVAGAPGKAAQVLEMSVAVLLAIGLYLGAAVALRMREATFLLQYLRSRLWGGAR